VHVLLAGKGQQLPGELAGAPGSLFGLQEVRVKRFCRIDLRHGHLQATQDHAEHVVKIVGHASGQPSDGLHLLRLLQLSLQQSALLIRLGAGSRHSQVVQGVSQVPGQIEDQRLLLGVNPGNGRHLHAEQAIDLVLIAQARPQRAMHILAVRCRRLGLCDV